MKKIINSIMALMLAFTYACSNDQIGAIYEPGNDKAEFTSSDMKYKFQSADESVITLTVTRINANGSAEVPITATSESDVFNIPQKVTFADGAREATITVSVNYNALVLGENYTLTLNLPKHEVKEAVVSTTITVSRDYTWKTVATGNFVSPIFEFSAETQLMQANEDTNVYKVIAPYETGYDLQFTVNDDQTIALPGGLNEVGLYDFETGAIYGSYGMVSAYVYPNSKFDLTNKTLTLNMLLYVGAGSLGESTETFTWE